MCLRFIRKYNGPKCPCLECLLIIIELSGRNLEAIRRKKLARIAYVYSNSLHHSLFTLKIATFSLSMLPSIITIVQTSKS